MSGWACVALVITYLMMAGYKLCSPRAEITQLGFLVAAGAAWLVAIVLLAQETEW